MRRYRLLDHTADLGVLFYGDEPAEVFVHAGLVLAELMVARPPRRSETSRELSLTGSDLADLLVRFLGEEVYFFQVQRQVVVGVGLDRLTGTELTARLDMASFDPTRHQVRFDVKAATYHQLEFGPHGRRWRARVVLDL